MAAAFFDPGTARSSIVRAMTLHRSLAIIVALCMFAVSVVAAPVDGYWLGTLKVDEATKLRLQLNVESDASGLRCKLDSLDQMAYGIDCSNVEMADQELAFDIPPVKGRYVGKLSADGKQLSGTWTQGPTWPLMFERQATLQGPPPRKKPAALPAVPPVSAADMQAQLTKDFDQLLKSGALAPGTGIGVTIGVLRNGERRVFSFGAAKPDSLFEIGSITKTFTGLMLAQMIEQQQVTAEQPVRTLLPENAVPKPSGPEITLIDLVTHTSGLPRIPGNFDPSNPANPYLDYTTDRLYAFLAQQGVAKPADAKHSYSNLGFGLLGQALANRAKVDYPALLNQLVTTPLCMTDTVVQLDEAHKARFIQGHTHNRKPTGPWEFTALAGAGAIRSTADDLLKYLAAQMQPAPCGSAPESPHKKTLVEAIKRSQTPQLDVTPGAKIVYAWFVDSETGSYVHEGGTGGYTAYAFFNPQQRYAAIVLTNLAVGPDGIFATWIGAHVQRRLAGKEGFKLE
jgi:CubicO group peptidase (beta-lactamase class C family)